MVAYALWAALTEGATAGAQHPSHLTPVATEQGSLPFEEPLGHQLTARHIVRCLWIPFSIPASLP